MSREQVLVSTQWVVDHLSDKQVVIIEVDEDTTAYRRRGHIPGAVAFDWTRDLQQRTSRNLLDRFQFAELMAENGISRDHTVVLYGGNHNWFAAYAYWYFRLYGHPDVRLMDGGRMRWEAQGLPISFNTPTRSTTDYQAPELDYSLRAMRDDVLARLNTDLFVDVRSIDEFSGLLSAPAHLPQEGGHQRGHIPGALGIPWNRAVTRDGTFRDDHELQQLYATAFEDTQRRVVTYCRIGERSSHTWFVLHELLGHPNVVNYDGSWVEYGSLIGVPIGR